MDIIIYFKSYNESLTYCKSYFRYLCPLIYL